MNAHRAGPAIVGACVVAAAIGGFTLLNRPRQAAAGQRWSNERLVEQVEIQPVRMEHLRDAGVQVVEKGRHCGLRWARLQMPSGVNCNVYLDDQGRVDSVLGDLDPRGTWNDVVPIEDWP